jgi:hypothetical protein
MDTITAFISRKGAKHAKKGKPQQHVFFGLRPKQAVSFPGIRDSEKET